MPADDPPIRRADRRGLAVHQPAPVSIQPCGSLLLAQFIEQLQEPVRNLLGCILFIDPSQILVDLLLDGCSSTFLTPGIHFLVIPGNLVRTLPNRYLSDQVPTHDAFFEVAMTAADLAQSISRELPYLRRYARALTGSQTAGDNYAAATLEAILTDRSLMDGEDSRIGLFRTFHAIWQSSGQPVELVEAQTPREASAQAHLRGLTPNSREALLLRTIEELRYDQIAQVMQCPQTEAEELVQIALNEMSQSLAGKVMVIEDETI